MPWVFTHVYLTKRSSLVHYRVSEESIFINTDTWKTNSGYGSSFRRRFRASSSATAWEPDYFGRCRERILACTEGCTSFFRAARMAPPWGSPSAWRCSPHLNINILLATLILTPTRINPQQVSATRWQHGSRVFLASNIKWSFAKVKQTWQLLKLNWNPNNFRKFSVWLNLETIIFYLIKLDA